MVAESWRPEQGRDWDFTLSHFPSPPFLELVAEFYPESWAEVQLLCGSGFHCQGSRQAVEEIPVGWVVQGKPWILGRPGMGAPQVPVGFVLGFLYLQQPPLCPGLGWAGCGCRAWVGEGAPLQHLAGLGCTHGTDIPSPPLELVTLSLSLNKLTPQVLTGCD